MKEKLETFKARVKAMRAEFQAEGNTLLKGALADMFAAFPQLTRIEWLQYTPYFNDGDTCEFDVNSPDFYIVSQEALDCNAKEKAAHDAKQVEIAGLSDEQRKTLGVELEEWTEPDSSEFEESFSFWSWHRDDKAKEHGKELAETAESFSNFVTSSEAEAVLYDVFGDHAKVTATRDGIEVEEYEHE